MLLRLHELTEVEIDQRLIRHPCPVRLGLEVIDRAAVDVHRHAATHLADVWVGLGIGEVDLVWHVVELLTHLNVM